MQRTSRQSQHKPVGSPGGLEGDGFYASISRAIFGRNSISIKLFVWNSKHLRLIQRQIKEFSYLLTESCGARHELVVIYIEHFHIRLANQPGFHYRKMLLNLPLDLGIICRWLF